FDVAIPGYDITGTNQPIANRPVACTAGDPNHPKCGQSAIIGSSLTFGITQNSKLIVPGWCSKNLAVVPCVKQYVWHNTDTEPRKYDVEVQDEEMNDLYKAGSSG